MSKAKRAKVAAIVFFVAAIGVVAAIAVDWLWGRPRPAVAIDAEPAVL